MENQDLKKNQMADLLENGLAALGGDDPLTQRTTGEEEAEIHSKFTVNVAMNVRAYGTVEVRAATLDDAIETMTHEYIALNFTPSKNDGGLDHSSPSQVWMESYTINENHDDEEELEIDLDAFEGASVLVYAGQGVVDAWNEAPAAKEHLKSVADLNGELAEAFKFSTIEDANTARRLIDEILGWDTVTHVLDLPTR